MHVEFVNRLTDTPLCAIPIEVGADTPARLLLPSRVWIVTLPHPPARMPVPEPRKARWVGSPGVTVTLWVTVGAPDSVALSTVTWAKVAWM